MKPPTVHKYLHLMGATYRRTKYSLRHQWVALHCHYRRQQAATL